MRHLYLSSLLLVSLTSGCVSLEHSRNPTAKDCRSWDGQRRGWTVAGGVALACAGGAGASSAFPAGDSKDVRAGLALTSGACALLSGFAFNQAEHAGETYAMACSSRVPEFEPEPLPVPAKEESKPPAAPTK